MIEQMPTTPLAIAINLVGVASAVLTMAVGARGSVVCPAVYDSSLRSLRSYSFRIGETGGWRALNMKVWMI